uniref:Thioredoxin peroxidase 1 n=2 Tax=Chromera velia TaxID=505693 RepID=A0A2K8DNX8_9ALVE|nr:Thioredoxin peroxidase 1 [Chromera velia]|mmetsp:Transcript_1451/g.3018  ORF Transcript_1451/g.3018 Transcript_1451/m.3018 type:complete len:233 (+) Transcript_1451:130-828(+)|eukprot:Cvel_7404.t1-p1 / transcript=Cvel_7404.t1 / gene=Cvel_7404 / organism=Chromera_velia_CCMP2878 / gene_product=Probable peroxiredoxin, putative / transcript_product=Probable peroxiredoxin, putative / location=Cvel_scaffold386:54918-56976(+) / protein_length=232 / sequence_SO=supercontig / SO=protein_coding / is_pseudo=false
MLAFRNFAVSRSLLAVAQQQGRTSLGGGARGFSALTFQKIVGTGQAPDFQADAVYGDNSIKPLRLSDYFGKKYVCLFFYPADWTFVCPSEIIAFGEAYSEFQKRGAEVIGCSTDTAPSHFCWKATEPSKGGIGQVPFPIVADVSKKISSDYGVLHESHLALRGLFLIDKAGVVRHSVVNDFPVGRDVHEALRALDAIQFHESHGDVCPANWKAGEKGMKASFEGVKEYLSEK